MRTKTLLLTAVCAVAGSVAVSAQSVYSVNAVGYVNVTCDSGFSLVANPLSAATNTLSGVITGAADNTTVYLWTGHTWDIATYYTDGGWDNDYAYAPGTAAWVYNSSGAPFTLTFVGEVSQGALSNPITTGFSLKGSMVPQSGALDTVLGFTPTDLDTVYLWRNHSWAICSFYADDATVNTHVGSWDTVPTPGVAEGFWILTSENKTWDRTFNINN